MPKFYLLFSLIFILVYYFAQLEVTILFKCAFRKRRRILYLRKYAIKRSTHFILINLS